MNNTLATESLDGTGPRLIPGALAVPRRFIHPDRGPVHCPAAPAFAAHLAERIGPVAENPLVAPVTLTAEGGRCKDSVLLTATYLDADGRAVGLAVAAHREDARQIGHARARLAEWAAIMRTRRVLIADHPACPGEECAHFAEASASILEFADHGDRLALIGDRTLPATERLHRLARRHAMEADVVDVPGAAAALDGLGELSYVLVPGTPIPQAAAVLAELRRRFPALRGRQPDEFCRHTTDRLETLRALADVADLALLAASPGTQRTWRLAGRQDSGRDHDLGAEALAHATCVRHTIADATELRPRHLDGYAIAVVPSRESDRTLVREITDVITGLGPHSILHRTTRGTGAARAPELRRSRPPATQRTTRPEPVPLHRSR